MNPSDIFSALAVAASILALFVALFRRQSHVEADLHARVDVAEEEAKRLKRALEEAQDALKDARAKLNTGTVLTNIAGKAAHYAEAIGGTGAEKLATALQAAQRLDADDNGKRDYTDAQLRIAIEAVLREGA